MSSTDVIIKLNHSTVEDRRVKMGARNFLTLIFLCSLVSLINGYDLRRGRLEGGSPTAEDCSRPPMSKFGHECCRLPKERIWGDLRPSLNMCFKTFKQESGPMRQEEADEGREVVTPTGDPSESSSTPAGERRGKRPHGRTPFSERVKELFSSVYKEIKSTIDSIRQSVVIITDHFRRRANDSCFMECVFEDQGFLVEKVLNKNALLDRLSQTLGQNEPWHKVAAEAVETCYQMEVPSNNTCKSGSEELFKCVLKQIFFNCPNWTQNDYCISLKEFYQKCPNGPPPEINDNHSTTSAPPVEEEMETSPPTETERYTQSE